MTSVALEYQVNCPPERVKALMLDETFLHAFLDEQHPTTKTLVIDRDRQTSALSWTIRLDGDLPPLITRFVGRTADLRLAFDLRDSRVDMTAKAKRTGTLACDFRIDSDGVAGTALRVDGRLSVSGAFGGMAETTVRDQVIEPDAPMDVKAG